MDCVYSYLSSSTRTNFATIYQYCEPELTNVIQKLVCKLLNDMLKEKDSAEMVNKERVDFSGEKN